MDKPAAPAPLVTVVMATYNWATVLPYSIGSALRQTMGDFELLVIGDGCTDESATVVQNIADPRVRWMNLPANVGSQAGPNNVGLRRARGKFIAYLGHDDLWLPDHLRLLVAAMQSGAGIAYALQLRVQPERSPFVVPTPSWNYKIGSWLPPTSFMHRADHGRAIGGWRLPANTGNHDPESDFCGRMARDFALPARVEHVTSIKFPAAHRKNVYRLRPCHEQERWSRRIQEAPDPEQMAWDSRNDPVDVSLGKLPEEAQGLQLKTAAERHAMRRRIKGLEP